MEIIIAITGIAITLLSFGFGIIQWKSNVSSKKLYNQNIRKLWDMSRSYSPYRITTDKLKNKTEDRDIISYIESSHTYLSTIFRELTPIYIQSVSNKLNYEFVIAMIGNGEIESSWTLRLVLMEIEPGKRNKEKDRECYEYLKETKSYLTDIKDFVNMKQAELKENRKNYSN